MFLFIVSYLLKAMKFTGSGGFVQSIIYLQELKGKFFLSLFQQPHNIKS